MFTHGDRTAVLGREGPALPRSGVGVQHGVAPLLKQRTAHTHARVEACLGLLDPALTADRLRVVITSFAGFWTATETLVDAWAVRRPQEAAELDWPRRRRSPLLLADVRTLGGDTAELRTLVPAAAELSDADVLGWLYVSEGSTLGGAVIDRALQRLPDGAGLRLASFTPYPEGPGPMWRAFLHYVEHWVRDDAQRLEALLSAAVASFEALEAWLAPVAVEVLA